MIKIVSFEEIQDCKFKPEPHTVAFLDKYATWFAYLYGGKIVSCLAVQDKHGGKYISSCYTLPEYRRRGLLATLIMAAVEEYPKEKFIAHCLISSKHIFENCGFEHYRTVNYKHGTQYFMRLNRGD